MPAKRSLFRLHAKDRNQPSPRIVLDVPLLSATRGNARQDQAFQLSISEGDGVSPRREGGHEGLPRPSWTAGIVRIEPIVLRRDHGNLRMPRREETKGPVKPPVLGQHRPGPAGLSGDSWFNNAGPSGARFPGETWIP